MKKVLVKFGLLTLLIVYFCFFGCGKDKSSGPDDNVSNTDFVAADSFSFQVEVTTHITFRLEGINGNITITALSGTDSIIVIAEKRVGSESTEDAEAHLKELGYGLRIDANEIYVETTQPVKTYGRSYVVDYNITLPNDLRMIVTNVNGSVTIDSCNCFVTVVNVNGQVTFNEIFGGVFVTLTNGDIQAEVTLPADEVFDTIDMAVANGDVDLDIPKNTSARFMASVLNGTISISDLALKDPVSTATSLKGTFGDGKGVIALSLGNGDLRVSGF